MIDTDVIRALDHAELSRADATLTEWLVGSHATSLATTYPQIFLSAGETRAFGVFGGSNDALRSHAAVRRVSLISSGAAIRASFVGVVATDPEARGEQLASGLLHFIADREAAAGQDVIVLWSDRWEFYARLGYAAAGAQAEIEVPASDVTIACRTYASADLQSLTQLHARKPMRVDRDAHEMRLLIEHTATNCFVHEDARGEVIAYACHGKGLDFGGWWHEFGGSDADVAALVRSAMRQLGQSIATVLVPPYRNELFDLLAPGAKVDEGIVALAKPLTANGAIDLFVDGLDSV